MLSPQLRIRARAALVGLLFLCAAGGPRAPEALPQDLSDFVSGLRASLQAGKYDEVRAAAADPTVMNWLGKNTRRQVQWKVAATERPTAGRGPASYLIVFNDFHTCESIGDHIHLLQKRPDGWKVGPEIVERDTRGFRVRDHDLIVTLDLPNSGCAITDDVTMERVGPAGTMCLLRLSSDMKVASIQLHGRPLAARIVPGLIAFTAPVARKFRLHLAYSGTVNHPGSDYIRPGEVVLCSYWYPHIARLPARHGVTVTVPSDWTAVGEGEQLGRSESTSGVTYRFRNDIPTCYFTLDAGPYKITSRTVGGRRLSIYELSEQPGRAERALDTLAKCLSWYDHNFSRYPYTHYEAVETLGPFDGALEAYSFSTYNRGMFGAIPHEVSHTWWGGIVPCPYTRSMWNESFASYSPGLWQRLTGSDSQRKALRGGHQRIRSKAAADRPFPVPLAQAFDTSSGADSSAGYGKGAMVLAMLEDLLGTQAMLRAMRVFIADVRPGDAADWPDFERAVRKVTGTDYGWFFRQWVDRPGVPVIRLAEAHAAPSGDRWIVSGRITQSGDPYRLRIPIELSLPGGHSERQDVDLRDSSAAFSITVNSKPTAVHLDPDGSLLAAGEPGEADPFTVNIGEESARFITFAKRGLLIPLVIKKSADSRRILAD